MLQLREGDIQKPLDLDLQSGHLVNQALSLTRKIPKIRNQRRGRRANEGAPWTPSRLKRTRRKQLQDVLSVSQNPFGPWSLKTEKAWSHRLLSHRRRTYPWKHRFRQNHQSCLLILTSHHLPSKDGNHRCLS